MQFWLFSYNPGPMTQGLGNCVLMISSPLNVTLVTASLCSQFSQSLCLLPCVATEAFIPLQVPDQPGQSQGWGTSVWVHWGWKGRESQVRKKWWLWGAGHWENQGPPQHQTGLKSSAALILCFKPAGVGGWPGCPSWAVVTHVGQESVQELQLRCSWSNPSTQLWWEQYPVNKQNGKMESAPEQRNSARARVQLVSAVGLHLSWALYFEIFNYMITYHFGQMPPPQSKHKIKLLKG